MKNINLSMLCSILLSLLSCSNNIQQNDKNLFKQLTGTYAKLWVWKSDDSLDCSCYYELIFKSGKMRHIRIDKNTGKFVDYFNELSGDFLNFENGWHYNLDTLNLMGIDYRIINTSNSFGTISLEQVENKRKYYLIDAKLIEEPN